MPNEPEVLPVEDWQWLADQLRAWPERRVHEDRTMSIGALHKMAADVIEHCSTRPSEDEVERLREAVEPWADYHGDLPDYDHPLRCVFESGVQYTVELLAKELGVVDWTPCEATEEFDGDLGGTLMNIILAAMPKDEHGDPMWPQDVRAVLASSSTSREERADVLNDIAVMMSEFVDNWPNPKRISTALALIAKTLRSSLQRDDGEPLTCPRSPSPLRYCPDCDGSFPCQLPVREER